MEEERGRKGEGEEERKGRGGLIGREEGEFNFVLHVSGETSILS